jgi:hypothetical protein
MLNRLSEERTQSELSPPKRFTTENMTKRWGIKNMTIP